MADDPKYKIINEFQRIPVIPPEKLITFLRENHMEDESISTWVPLAAMTKMFSRLKCKIFDGAILR